MSKSDVFEVVLCLISIVEELSVRNFSDFKEFFRICTLRVKSDVQLTIDDSYIPFVSKIDAFKLILC